MMIVTQAFPLSVKSICAGIIESLAQIGTFLGPVIVTVCINLQIQAMIVISFIALATIFLPSFMIKEKGK